LFVEIWKPALIARKTRENTSAASARRPSKFLQIVNSSWYNRKTKISAALWLVTKEHRDSPQCATKDLVGKKAENAFQEEPTLHVPFSTDDTVPAEKLQQLGAFTYSLNQQLLIVFPRRTLPGAAQLAPQSPPALAAPADRCGHECPVAMMAAMQEPLFVEFANACLQVVEPMTDAEKAELELCS